MHSGSLFCHFKSKDALLYEVMQEGMRSALARQMIVLLSEHDAATTLRQEYESPKTFGSRISKFGISILMTSMAIRTSVR